MAGPFWKRRRGRVLLGVGGLALALFVGAAWSGRLPLRSLLTFVQFKLRPDRARTQHLAQLRHPQTGQVVYLLGTTHHHHYTDDAYSIWHVKAAVLGLGVKTVFVEIMPDAVQEGRLGEGPVEMPFIALVAKEAGLSVVGMDAGWDGGWRGRQDRMFEAVQSALPQAGDSVVASGFMHVRSFVEQLEAIGFQQVHWPEEERTALFDKPVQKTWPPGLRETLQAAIVTTGKEGQPGDPTRQNPGWFIEVRESVLGLMAKDGR